MEALEFIKYPPQKEKNLKAALVNLRARVSYTQRDTPPK
jgi:hypothetical protein